MTIKNKGDKSNKDVSGEVQWAKGKQINRPNEAEIRRWLSEVL